MNKISRQGALRRAEYVLGRSGVLDWLDNKALRKVETKEGVSVRAFLLACAVTGILGEDMLLTNVTRTLRRLSSEGRLRLGISSRKQVSYRKVERLFNQLYESLKEGFDQEGVHCDVQRYLDCLMEATMPVDIDLSNSYALDSTDFESWARRRSWGKDDRDTETKETDSAYDDDPESESDLSAKSPGPSDPSYPKIGPDGRQRHCADLDATEGYRTGRNGRKGEIFLGYDIHALCVTKAYSVDGDAAEMPILVRRLLVEPAGSHKGDAGLNTIDLARDQGITVDDALPDRAYTHSNPVRFHHPVRKGGTEIVLDLRKEQRGEFPTGIDGVIGINGSFFVDALPQTHRDLPGAPQGAKRKVREEHQAKFDYQAKFAFERHGMPDADGYQRFRGPARCGKVRCVNYGPSMRKAIKGRPRTSCVKGEPCMCGKTFTAPPTLAAKIRQRHVWGTTAWWNDYSRRIKVESGFSGTKRHFARMSRGYTQVFTLEKNALLLVFGYVAANLAEADAFRDREGMPTFFDPEDELFPGRRRRVAQKRRQEGYDTLLKDKAAPGPDPPDG